ncbi:hypothetical protein AK812_SmicGene29234, partial [Symbiodinium microadriaticum]
MAGTLELFRFFLEGECLEDFMRSNPMKMFAQISQWDAAALPVGCSMRCVTFGCPQVLDASHALALSNFTTSVVLGDDLVPRLSLTTVGLSNRRLFCLREYARMLPEWRVVMVKSNGMWLAVALLPFPEAGHGPRKLVETIADLFCGQVQDLREALLRLNDPQVGQVIEVRESEAELKKWASTRSWTKRSLVVHWDEMTCDWCGVSSVARTTGFEVEDLLDPEMEKKRQSFEETVKRKVKDRPDGYAVKLEKWSSELSDKPVPKSEGEKLKMQTDTSTRSWSACWIHTSGRRHYNEQQWLRTYSSMKGSASLPASEESKYAPLEGSQVDVDELLLSSDMAAAHMPARYLKALGEASDWPDAAQVARLRLVVLLRACLGSELFAALGALLAGSQVQFSHGPFGRSPALLWPLYRVLVQACPDVLSLPSRMPIECPACEWAVPWFTWSFSSCWLRFVPGAMDADHRRELGRKTADILKSVILLGGTLAPGARSGLGGRVSLPGKDTSFTKSE